MIAAFQVLFEEKQWDYLADQFKQEFCRLYGMTLEPLLNIYLQAGLSALKTPYPCFAVSHGIFEYSSVNMLNSHTDITYDYWNVLLFLQTNSSPPNSTAAHFWNIWMIQQCVWVSDVYLCLAFALTWVRFCYEDDCTKEDPLSQEAFRKLAQPLPYSKQHHSKLVCYITKELMDTENPPLVLPNGYVYSTKVCH